MEAKDALEAIRARLVGEWDNPALLAFGPLSTDSTSDVLTLVAMTKPERPKFAYAHIDAEPAADPGPREFDVTLPLTLTFRVEAESAEKAEWALRHAFDSRHSSDPMAGRIIPIKHVESARVMVCTFDATDRAAVEVEPQ